MTDQQIGEVERLFGEALDLQPEERSAFLDRECSHRPEIRVQVEELLAHESRISPSFLRTPVGDISRDAMDLGADPLEGQEQIGPYRIVERIGEGGFGVVYHAEQTEPLRREVAIKLIKPGMDSRAVLARFEAERQALAMMDHPCVARVFDAGTTTPELGSRPYFVMERVVGVPITTYCEREGLDFDERLRLVCRVCEGLQHAHQKGLIHRDIKPSNILVSKTDGESQPKIIDFGVAKAIGLHLTGETIVTEQGQLIGTPEYMSPEQAGLGAIDVDIRSDVYSIGVLIYELLTGSLPFDGQRLRRAGLVEAQRIIQHEPPTKPSAKILSIASREDPGGKGAAGEESRRLARTVRGDLDWIVMRALEKERARRYASVAELATDLRRHLGNEPVSAGPPSVTYRLRKFTQRNRSLTVAGVAVLIVLIAGATTSTILAVGQTRARRSAEREATVAGFISGAFLDAAAPENLGPNATALDMLDAAAANVETTSLDPIARARVLAKLGDAYLAVGKIDAGAEQLEQAHKLYEDALGSDAPETLSVLADQASAAWELGDYEAAEALARRAWVGQQRVLGEDARETLATLHNLATIVLEIRRFDEAEKLALDLHERRSRTLGEDHVDTLMGRGLLCRVYLEQDDIDAGERMLPDLIEDCRRVLGEEDVYTLKLQNDLAVMYSGQQRYADAASVLQDLAPKMASAYGDNHQNTAICTANYGQALAYQAKYEDALPVLEEAVSRGEAAFSDHWILGVFLDRLGLCLTELGRYEEAEAKLLRAHALLESSPDPSRSRSCVEHLVALYTSWDRPETAARWQGSLETE